MVGGAGIARLGKQSEQFVLPELSRLEILYENSTILLVL